MAYILLEDGSGRIQTEDASGDILLEQASLTVVFGKFVAGAVYPPIMLANVKGIKPRIYTPIQNNTVRTKQ